MSLRNRKIPQLALRVGYRIEEGCSIKACHALLSKIRRPDTHALLTGKGVNHGRQDCNDTRYVGGGWYWENFKNFFEQRGYECFTPTLRHHDVDPQDDPHPDLGETSLLDYAQDLEEYIHKLDDKPILIGHSMGGLLAQILGSRGLAKALVLLTSASPSGVNALKFSVIKSFWSVLTKWGFWRKPQRLSFKTNVYSMLHLLSEEEQKTIYDKFVYESGRAAGEIGF